MLDIIKSELNRSIAIKQLLLDDLESLKAIDKLARLCAEAISEGNKLLFAGNGGSAADSQHLAAELAGRYLLEREGLPAIALTTDTSLLTAVGNDYGFEAIFQRQVEALGQSGDVLIGISTSGNSTNVLRAFAEARKRGLYCAGLAGNDGGRMAKECDLCIVVPATETPRIQESHITIGHILCNLIEQRLAAA